MKSLSSVGLGLSIVFGVLFLALIVELYYLLWWRKRLATTSPTSSRDSENDYKNPASELFYMFCWKKSALNPQEIRFPVEQQQAQVHHLQHSNKDLNFFKPFDVDGHDVDDDDEDESDDDDDDDMLGPPRVLFTIVEETKEDLESEDGKSRKGRSLSDVLLNVELETPYLTPIGSPPFLTPPLTPLEASSCCYGYNPLFESGNGEDLFNKLSLPSSSPPPKFKFLQEAEEKLNRKIALMEDVDNINGGFGDGTAEEDGSFITIIVDKKKENKI